MPFDSHFSLNKFIFLTFFKRLFYEKQFNSRSVAQCRAVSRSVAQLVLVFCAMFLNESTKGQTPCDSTPQSCLLLANSTQFKCATNFSGVAKNFSELINQQVLLPANQSATQPQFIIVDGLIIDDVADYTFAIGSEIVFLSGGLIVENTSKLKIKGTFLHGCTNLWNGITVNGKVEITQNSKIQDAKIGVRLLGSANLLCQNSKFDGNFICIKIEGSTGAVGISGCEFSGNKTLLTSFTSQGINFTKPHDGIVIEQSNQINIGLVGGVPSALNVFKSFTANQTAGAGRASGLHLFNSSVKVANSQFLNFGTLDDAFTAESCGIFVETANPFNKLTVEGNGIAKTSPVTFDNCTVGILVKDSKISVQNAIFNLCLRGIKAAASSSVESVEQVFISNNRFENICRDALDLGETNAKNINVNGNFIKFKSGGTYCDFLHRGIYMEGNTGLIAIENNSIIDESGTSSVNFRGIRINGSKDVKIKGNVISELNTSQSTSGFFLGLDLFDAPGAFLSLNTILGSRTNYNQGQANTASTGIFTQESANCFYSCNDVNNINNGIGFRGMSCDGADFRNNNMREHKVGLFLENFTRIGVQSKKGNLWFGLGTNQLEGFFNFQINNFDDQEFVKKSNFIIDSPESASNQRWANPRMVGTSIDADHVWFSETSNAPAVTDCFISYPPPEKSLTSSDLDIINGLFTPVKGFEATTWEAAFHTFVRIYQYPELRLANSNAEFWYNNQFNNNLGKLARYYLEIEQTNSTNSTLEVAKLDLENLLDQFSQKNEQWSSANSVAVQNQLAQDFMNLNVQIETAKSNLLNLASTNQSNINSAYQTLLNNLSGLSLSAEYEQNLATVLKIRVQSSLTSTPFSSTQVSTLQEIANKCRIAGGYGVLKARSALKLYDNVFTADDNCAVVPRSKIATETTKALLSPNPTSDEFQLNWEKSIEKADISLFDVSGRLHKSWVVSESNQFTGNTFDLNSGVYFVRINILGEPATSHLLVIHH